MKKLLLLIVILMACSSVWAIDPNVPGVSVAPLAYMPFENNDGWYGPGTGLNPAWGNHVNGEQPRIVDRGVDLWPVIGGPGDGVKGEFFDGASLMGSGETDILTYDTASGYTAAGETGLAMDGLKSHTITFWLRSRDDSTQSVNSTAYLMRGAVQLYWTNDGKIGHDGWNSLGWTNSAPDTYDSYGEWIFVAVTMDTSGTKFYKGDDVNAPELVWMVDASNTGGPANSGYFYLGGRSYVGPTYFSYCLDELRIWGSKVDSSAALSLDDITDVWAYDYDPTPTCGDSEHPQPSTDLTGDCKVDFEDFALMAEEWMTDTGPM